MLIVDGIIYSLQRHGGITVYFNELLQRIAAQDVPCRTVVYTGASEHVAALPSNLEVRQLRLAERYRRCVIPAGGSVFHSSYYRLPATKIAAVTTVHDFTYEHFVNGPRRWLHSWQKFSAIRGSQAIICISENTRRDLLHFLPDVDPARIHVIYNGVGDAFSPTAPETTTSDGRPYVLFVGARGGYKHFAVVVAALTQLPDMGLVCVGGGPLQAEERLLIDKHLSKRFMHRLGVSEQELNVLYNDAYCLAYPSAYEGFGIPVLEAMRAGCPVVAVNGSSIPEVAGEAALLLTRPDVDELVHAIKQLESRELRVTLRKRGLEQANRFSWRRTFEETLSVYKTVSDKPL